VALVAARQCLSVLQIAMRTLGLCYFTVCFQLAFNCHGTKDSLPAAPQKHTEEQVYLDKRVQLGPYSEQWRVTVDFTLKAGKSFHRGPLAGNQTATTWSLPVPEDAFWLESVHVMITDWDGTEQFGWPPVHLHHLVCRSQRADVWHDKDVFDHNEVFLSTAGGSHMNEQLKRYDVVNGSDGWAAYFPAGTEVKCGFQIDDDRLKGHAQQYKLVINMKFVMDADRLDGPRFRQFGVMFWEGTTTGQIGYNVPSGTTNVFSKDYEAPEAGSFHPDSLSCHTHPGGKWLKFFARRLGGQDFTTPQGMFTMHHTNLTVESGSQSRELNAKPGIYVRQPKMEWSEIGLKWLTGSLFTSGVDGKMPLAFQKGDIFYLQAHHEVEDVSLDDMMSLHSLVLWSEPPQVTHLTNSFDFSGFLRNQLFPQYYVPHDLLAEVPRKVNRSVLHELHSKMPLWFGDPDRVFGAKYLACVRNKAYLVLRKATSINDVNQKTIERLQKTCDGRDGF